MMILRVSLTIYRYELKRSFSFGATLLWLLVIVFPTFLQTLIDQGSSLPEEYSGVLLVCMIPGAVCLMTILNTMAPYLNTELEGNTWPYIAVRPHGRTALMAGKYLVAITRSMIAGFLAIALVFLSTSLNQLNRDVPPPIVPAEATADNSEQTALANLHPDVNDKVTIINVEKDVPYPLWLSLVILVILSSFCYSALFCLLGTIMHKRPMVLAIIYTLLVEGVISSLPAVVNAFTINYYLRSIFLRLMGWELTDLPNILFLNNPNSFSQMSTFGDLICLGILCSIFLFAANILLRNREYHVGETL
ncbi:MAG: hypothetical protein CMJ76_03420 [Planctomycetaceae bacterium]|nr:hypothetical protein [Planctomycetaceae bacterium]|tara:strand:+ start:461 stop:1375 length:915 start_codon:yes stop_codon:yes gene_type:complete